MRADVSLVLQYKGYVAGPFAGQGDFVASLVDGAATIAHWSHADPQPTSEQIDQWAEEPGYATWLAEHGGDATATLRRQAREALDAQSQHLIEVDKAVLVELLLYTNAKLTTIANYLKTKFPADATAMNNFVAGLATAEQGIEAVKDRLNGDA